MRVLHLLAVPLLASMWIAPAVAQSVPSLPDHSSFAAPPFLSQPLPGSHNFSLDAGKGTFFFSPNPAGTGFNPAVPPLHLRRFSLFPSGQDPSILFQLAPLRTQGTVIVARNEVCYSIREYDFTRDRPDSDATRMTEYHACRPSGEFHLKGIAPTSAR